MAMDGRVLLSVDPSSVSASAAGEVLRAAAVDSAYRRYRGTVKVGEEEHPLTVSALALIFDSPATAATTFAHVAEAAHLRTQLRNVDVAVETVTGRAGLVSYWGFVHQSRVIVVVTLDTVDPMEISVADLRGILMIVVQHLEMQGNGQVNAG